MEPTMMVEKIQLTGIIATSDPTVTVNPGEDPIPPGTVDVKEFDDYDDEDFVDISNGWKDGLW